MPNIKSAIKRVSIIEKKTLRNNMVKSEYKTAVKKFENAFSRTSEENLGLTSTISLSIFPSIFVTAYVQSSLTLYSTAN